jgi:hypothetical protein
MISEECGLTDQASSPGADDENSIDYENNNKKKSFIGKVGWVSKKDSSSFNEKDEISNSKRLSMNKIDCTFKRRVISGFIGESPENKSYEGMSSPESSCKNQMNGGNIGFSLTRMNKIANLFKEAQDIENIQTEID